MEAEYWQQKWNDEKIGFHQSRTNKRLQEWWPSLGVAAGATVLVPLCGKSLDMLWLHEQGHKVLGIELSEKAVRAFFDENNLTYTQSQDDVFTVFNSQGSATGITLMVGDFFALTAQHCKPVSAIFDRASMIAMPPDMRRAYARHLADICAPQTLGLLLTIDYDNSKMDGPPFAVSDANARELLSTGFDIQELTHYSGPERVGNLADRGLETLEERVYRLHRL